MEAAQTLLASIADKYIELQNVKIAYQDKGNGQIILCLHAIGHSSKDFISLYNLPLDRFRVISIDFPSHGNSSSTNESVSSAYYSELVASFIRKLNLRNIIIVGNSIGGATAIRLASNNSNITMLSLSNSAGLDKGGFIASLFLSYMVRFFQKGVDKKPEFKKKFDNYYQKVLTTEAAAERREEITNDAYKIAPVLVQSWKSFKSKAEDLRPLIETINCPVLITWGMKDKYVQFSRNKAAIGKFKNQTLIKYDIGHTPYIECPEMFLRDFQEYYKNNSR